MVAAMFNQPAIAISSSESEMLASALVDFSRAWGVGRVVDPRVTSSLALLATAGFIYGPRVMAIRAQRKAEPQPDGTMMQ